MRMTVSSCSSEVPGAPHKVFEVAVRAVGLPFAFYGSGSRGTFHAL